jgi:hypothetical protein
MTVCLELWLVTGLLSDIHMIHERIWGNTGMILIGENCRAQRKPFSVSLKSTTDPAWANLGVNPGLHSEKPVLLLLFMGWHHTGNPIHCDHF